MSRRRINTDRLKLELRRARVPFAFYVALVTGGLAVTLAILGNQTFQRPWDDYRHVRVALDDAKGIVPGKQEVRIAGVKVGVMESVDVRGGRPVVTLAILREHGPLYRNARFRLRPVTPLQDMYMSVKRGSRSAGELAEDAVVPAERTTSPVDISRVLQTFEGETRERLGTLLDGLGRGLDDRGTELRQAFAAAAPFLRSAQDVTGALAQRRRALRRAMSNLADIAEAVGGRDRQLASLVQRGDRALGALAAEDVPLDRTLRELPGALEELRGSMAALGRTHGDLDPALEDLRGVAAELEDGVEALGSFSRDARPALVALRPALRGLRPLARDLRPTSDALAGAFTELRAQAPAYDSLTRQLLPCRDGTRDFFAWTPSVLKWGDSYGAFPRGDMSYGFDSAPDRVTGTGLKRYPNCTEEK